MKIGVHIKLKASTLIEAVVASTIFLIVFLLSLETVSRLFTGGRDDELVMIEADHRTDVCFAVYGTGEYPPGTYTDEFDWGTVSTEIEYYDKNTGLLQVTVSAAIKNSRRPLTYRYVIRNEHE